MVALFAFIAGLVWDLPWQYFVVGFICLMLDGGVEVNKKGGRR